MSGMYEDLKGPEIPEVLNEKSILLLPIGAIEQHGPHLPLSVDHVIADETARAVVEACGEEVDIWMLPTLSISKSNEHEWSTGTISLGYKTLMAVLEDIGRSVSATPAKKLVLLNGHGGNTTMLSTALRELRLKYSLQTFLMHPSLPPAYGGESNLDELGMGIHGGRDETSVFMFLRPEHVNLEKAERRIPEGLSENTHVKFGGSVSFGWLSNDFHEDGYIGDPTGASSELGEKLFRAAVASLSEAMEEIRDFSFGR
ncbi:MAG TPA: creatininase family protein [Acidimicrobiales bacterium]|jgi:creatinine amidohydrolase|nr:creatininase family protein [Acidimicrobiales bacterium]HJM28826.1 creatininase family protein [Acidimicrobiales bacterium]HJM97800.1 creatininase family protein [Acidimicrobiales bacterium]